jgi:post-segregation antitoxin (ccd killing protein)
MKLLNVRLGPEDAQKAARLREAGIPISRVVREAIRAAHDRHAAARAARRPASEIMADIYREYPDRPSQPRKKRDLSDRVAVRRLIRQRLRRRRA